MSTTFRKSSSLAAYCRSGREIMQSPTVTRVKPSGTLVSSSRESGRCGSNLEASLMPGSTPTGPGEFCATTAAQRKRKARTMRINFGDTAFIANRRSIPFSSIATTDEETSYRIWRVLCVRIVPFTFVQCRRERERHARAAASEVQEHEWDARAYIGNV